MSRRYRFFGRCLLLRSPSPLGSGERKVPPRALVVSDLGALQDALGRPYEPLQSVQEPLVLLCGR